MTPIGPITPGERINSLDTLRGFALLGILPANVLVFGMYFTAGTDPTVAGGATGLNLASWAMFHILIQGKMRCLFSMVFGASMILLTSRAEPTLRGKRRRHLLSAEPLAAPLRPGTRIRSKHRSGRSGRAEDSEFEQVHADEHHLRRGDSHRSSGSGTEHIPQCGEREKGRWVIETQCPGTWLNSAWIASWESFFSNA